MALSASWLASMESGVKDVRWDNFDTSIKSEVTAYNVRFAGTAGFTPVNWLLVKAMVWNESGGPDHPSQAWAGRVMQIGNAGDPAYGVLRAGSEGASLVLPADLKTLLAKDDNVNRPEINVRAGIAYLYTRMALYGIHSVISPWAVCPAPTYTVLANDSFDRIAKKVGTTVENLQANNKVKPTALRPGMVLTYDPASMERYVSGWRKFQTAIVADRYNGGGDAEYSAKLSHLMNKVFNRLVR